MKRSPRRRRSLISREEILRFTAQQAGRLQSYVERRYLRRQKASFDVLLQISFNPKLQNHYGAWELCRRTRKPRPRLKLVLDCNRARRQFYHEYEFLADLPGVGELEDVSWKQAITGILCHELAHCLIYCAEDPKQSLRKKDLIQSNQKLYKFYNEGFSRSKASLEEIDHGPLFRALYASLRARFMTNRDQSSLKNRGLEEITFLNNRGKHFRISRALYNKKSFRL